MENIIHEEMTKRKNKDTKKTKEKTRRNTTERSDRWQAEKIRESGESFEKLKPQFIMALTHPLEPAPRCPRGSGGLDIKDSITPPAADGSRFKESALMG